MVESTSAVGLASAVAVSANEDARRPVKETTERGASATSPGVAKKEPSSEEKGPVKLRDTGGERVIFRIDENDGLIVRIVDGSGKLIRQIPPEEIVALTRRMEEAIGVLFDRTA